MQYHTWRALLAVASFGALSAASNPESGTITGLGPLLASQSNLTTFYSLIQKYPNILLQLPSYQGVTILAPSNDAFSRIPYTQFNTAFADNDEETITNVLEYHILQGTRLAAELVPGVPQFIPTLMTSSNWTNVTGGQRVENVKQAGNVVVFVSGQGNRCTLIQADLEFTGGVVQVIDSILIPPTNITQTSSAFGLTSFEGALYAAKKIDPIIAEPNITMFAPNNAAFQALGPAIANMTAMQLSTILDYHIIPQTIYSNSFVNNTKFVTQQGNNLTIFQAGNNIYINSAQLLQSDILIANGVLHVIDNVLNPLVTDKVPNSELGTQLPVYSSPVPASDIPFTSAVPCGTNCPTPTPTPTASSTVIRVTGNAVTSFRSSTSRAQAVAMARETGFGAAGLVAAALGGAVMLI